MGGGHSNPFKSDTAKWTALRKAGILDTSEITVLLIADQDKESQVKGAGGKAVAWCSFIVEVKLKRHGTATKHTYTLEVVNKTEVRITEGDASGRGAEFSSLCYVNGQLLTCDDRTGRIYSLAKVGTEYHCKLLYQLADADGSNPAAGFKAEWLVVKDGLLHVGSHGRPESDPKARLDRMRWLKTVNLATGEVKHHDWARNFDAMAFSLGIDPAKGYVTHESALYSDLHKKWVFFPRRMDTEPWDYAKDPKRGSNVLLAVSPDFDSVMRQRVGPLNLEQGCADLDFVPHTGQSELVGVFTIEKGDVMESFVTVFDFDGKELMPRTKILSGLKLEGLCCVPKQ